MDLTKTMTAATLWSMTATNNDNDGLNDDGHKQTLVPVCTCRQHHNAAISVCIAAVITLHYIKDFLAWPK